MTRLERIIQAEEFVSKGQQIKNKRSNETFTIVGFSFNKIDMGYYCVNNADIDEGESYIFIENFDNYYECI